jgi:hypothetical protein
MQLSSRLAQPHLQSHRRALQARVSSLRPFPKRQFGGQPLRNRRLRGALDRFENLEEQVQEIFRVKGRPKRPSPIGQDWRGISRSVTQSREVYLPRERIFNPRRRLGIDSQSYARDRRFHGRFATPSSITRIGTTNVSACRPVGGCSTAREALRYESYKLYYVK